MRNSIKNLLAIVGFGLLLSAHPCLALAADPARDHRSEAENAHTLTIGISQEFDTLNPLLTSSSAALAAYAYAGRALVDLDNKGQWNPQLVETIPSFENGLSQFVEEGGKKKISATFRLRDGAHWGDGKNVTAEDVIFTWKLARTDGVPVLARSSFDRIEQITSNPRDPRQFTMVFRDPTWDFYQMDWFFVLPAHLEEPLLTRSQKEGVPYAGLSTFTSRPTEPGLYNGPFLIAEVKLGSHIRFRRNPHFYGKRPWFDEILLRVIPTTTALESHLLSKSIDMIHGVGLQFDQAIAFEKRIAEQKLPYRLVSWPGPVLENLVFNLDDPLLKDARVRHALALGLDRNALAQALFGGKVSVAHHFLHPSDPWYPGASARDDQTSSDLAPSKRRAQMLLREAGYSFPDEPAVRGQTRFLQKNGQHLKLRLMSTAGNRTREQIEAYIKEQWREIGVDVEIQNQPARVFFGETVRKRSFGQVALYANVLRFENVPRGLFHSSEIPTPENSYQGSNTSAWRNKMADALLEQLEASFDPKERIALASQLAAVFEDDLPILPLFFQTATQVVPIGLINKPGYTYFSALEVEHWSSAEGKQANGKGALKH